MKHFNDSIADTLTIVSGTSALAHLATSYQPIISAVAGLIAIISGSLAIWYYAKKIWG